MPTLSALLLLTTHDTLGYLFLLRDTGKRWCNGMGEGRTGDSPRFDVLTTIAKMFGYDFMMMLDELWMNDWNCTVFA